MGGGFFLVFVEEEGSEKISGAGAFDLSSFFALTSSKMLLGLEDLDCGSSFGLAEFAVAGTKSSKIDPPKPLALGVVDAVVCFDFVETLTSSKMEAVFWGLLGSCFETGCLVFLLVFAGVCPETLMSSKIEVVLCGLLAS